MERKTLTKRPEADADWVSGLDLDRIISLHWAPAWYSTISRKSDIRENMLEIYNYYEEHP